MKVVDASAIVEALVGSDATGQRARHALDHDCAAPELADIEVVAALRGLTSGSLLSPEVSVQAVRDLVRLRLRRYSHAALLERMWELRHNATPYDASYVALAEALGAPLVTADEKFLSISDVGCDIELISAA